MDYLELRKRKVFHKYIDSDIFNTKTESNLNKSYHPPKYSTTQPSLDKTKNDIFNYKEDPVKTKPLKKRQIHLKNYKSDIFNLNSNETKRKKSYQRIDVNFSTCFEGIKDNEEYKKDLCQYTLIHRPQQEEYKVDKYFNKDSAISRYYKELYGDIKNGIFPIKEKMSRTLQNSPEKTNNAFENGMKNYEKRKIRIKRDLTETNDVGADGKKIPGEHLGQEKDNKGNKIIYNKRRIDIYGQNLDNKNNREFIKEKNGIAFNHKLNKQLEQQSNIFNDNKKDLNTNMNEFIQNQIKEIENKKILIEKIKKEREEMNKKINEQKQQNVNNEKLYCSNIKWSDLGAQQSLFKMTFTMGDLNNNQEETTAFQRKMQDLSNSNNIDILSKKKRPINLNNLKKLNKTIDENNGEKINEIINNVAENDLRYDQKKGILNRTTTSYLFNDKTSDDKIKKIVNSMNKNIRSARQSKSKKKNDKFIKIMGKNSGINKTSNNSKNKTEHKVHDYKLVYPLKNNKFNNFDNKDITKILLTKGINAFDVKKNVLGTGDLNSVEFKVREDDENNEKNIEEKIKIIEDDFNNNKCKVTINKNKKKKITKDNRNPKEKEIKEKGKPNKTINNPKYKKSFTGQYPKINLQYKNNTNTKK